MGDMSKIDLGGIKSLVRRIRRLTFVVKTYVERFRVQQIILVDGVDRLTWRGRILSLVFTGIPLRI